MPTWLMSRWTAYAAAALALWGVWTWHGHAEYVRGSTDTRTLYEQASALGASNHAKELINAREEKQAEVARVRAWADAHSIGPVFLSARPTVVSAGGAPGAGACTPGGDVQPVPAGDTPVGPGWSADVGPLLQSLALHADAVTLANLREAQAVK